MFSLERVALKYLQSNVGGCKHFVVFNGTTTLRINNTSETLYLYLRLCNYLVEVKLINDLNVYFGNWIIHFFMVR